MPASNPNTIPALVKRLRTGPQAAQADAADALTRLGDQSASNQRAIAAAGAIPLLVQMMRGSGPGRAAAAAAGTLHVVTWCQDDLFDAFYAAGGLQPLCACLVRSDDAEAQSMAAMLAGNALARPDAVGRAVKHAVLAAGGIPALVSLLGSAQADSQIAGALTIQNLVRRWLPAQWAGWLGCTSCRLRGSGRQAPGCPPARQLAPALLTHHP